MATNLSTAAQQLIDAGNDADENELNEAINEAVTKFGQRVAAVQAGTLDKSALTIDDTSPQPAALDSGSQPVTDEAEALNVLIGSSRIDNGVKAALRRLLNPRDPNPLLVEQDGTPSDLRDAEQERDTQKVRANAAETAKTEAERKLAEEQDESKSGSLAKQLAEAKAANATPAKTVLSQEVLDGLKIVRDAVANIKQSPMKGGSSSKDAALAGIDAMTEEVEKHS
jgi:hypothetical protein